ncbi:hypothetical protein SPOG_05261 [Schizosaccharomyces cryophilus OY26]|uniref:Uncharacterized protein n=1 Tax=Schizosaccharomyces cryophilus (strain OY26 / ATCC MYA-4695 / CBS 11777 / NBRC 106824 / NRRL Y48691) TaxID=653667 RepID=S9VNT8_SCHCR|nr:uncharacterized protein SPOG_05261 [Schizosaccharomyces cryophilus OY26]EPY49638.1 hypothetical protein SPOG_05261 [Schizosaccharomyces cryophilus OY26]
MHFKKAFFFISAQMLTKKAEITYNGPRLEEVRKDLCYGITQHCITESFKYPKIFLEFLAKINSNWSFSCINLSCNCCYKLPESQQTFNHTLIYLSTTKSLLFPLSTCAQGVKCFRHHKLTSSCID